MFPFHIFFKKTGGAKLPVFFVKKAQGRRNGLLSFHFFIIR